MKAENRSGVRPSSILHAIRSLRGIFCDPMLIRDGRFTGEPSSPLERHTLHGHERSAEHGGRLRREPADGSNAADPMRLGRARTRPSHSDCSTRKLHVRHRPTARARSRCKPTAHCVSEAASDAVRLSKEDFRGFRSDLFDEKNRYSAHGFLRFMPTSAVVILAIFAQSWGLADPLDRRFFDRTRE